jgi:hypothetical protein
MSVLDKLLLNLQTIADIPRFGRIGTTKEFLIVEENTPLQGVWRRMNADSRDRAVILVCREVRTTIALVRYLSESRYLDERPPGSPVLASQRIEELTHARNTLQSAIKGINTLCQTYSADADVFGRLQPLIGEITECVRYLDDVIPRRQPQPVAQLEKPSNIQA